MRRNECFNVPVFQKQEIVRKNRKLKKKIRNKTGNLKKKLGKKKILKKKQEK